jgi:hypothetical protein
MNSLETRRKMNVKAAVERKQLSKFIILYMSKYLRHASLKIKVGKTRKSHNLTKELSPKQIPPSTKKKPCLLRHQIPLVNNNTQSKNTSASFQVSEE